MNENLKILKITVYSKAKTLALKKGKALLQVPEPITMERKTTGTSELIISYSQTFDYFYVVCSDEISCRP
jgi:hypothetical protein